MVCVPEGLVTNWPLAVAQSMQIQTNLRWVNGDRQLADPLTKGGVAKTMMMQFLAGGQWWTLVHLRIMIGEVWGMRSMKTHATTMVT